MAPACGKRDARGQEMRPAEGSRRIHALFRAMEGRNHPFRSARDTRMTAAPRRRRASPRGARQPKRDPTPMRIFSRPLTGVILIAIAAGAYGYARLGHRHPPRSAEVPKPARLALAPPLPP